MKKTFSILALLAFPLCALFAQEDPQVWLKFENDLTNSGTLTTVVPTAPSNGAFSTDAADGSYSYSFSKSALTLSPVDSISSKNFAVEAWVKWDTLGENSRLVGFTSDTLTYYIRTISDASGTRLRPSYQGAVPANYQVMFTPYNKLKSGTWYQLLWDVDADSNRNVFEVRGLNGATVYKTFDTVNIKTYKPVVDKTGPIAIGYGASFVGKVDNVKMWSSAALNLTLDCPPDITSALSVNVPAGVAWSYKITATDLNNDAITYSADQLPSWLSFNSSTNTVSGTAPSTIGETFSFRVMASDGSLADTVVVEGVVLRSQIYVDASYTGTEMDGSEAKPYVKVQDAIGQVPDGGQLLIKPGTYDVGEGLTGNAGITVKSTAGAAVTIIDGTNAKSDAYQSTPGWTIKEGWTIDGLTFTKYPLGGAAGKQNRIFAPLASDTNARVITIKNCVFTNNGVPETAISSVIEGKDGQVDKLLIHNNIFRDSYGAIVTKNHREVKFYNNVVYNYANVNVTYCDNIFNIYVYGQEKVSVDIRNNVFMNNKVYRTSGSDDALTYSYYPTGLVFVEQSGRAAYLTEGYNLYFGNRDASVDTIVGIPKSGTIEVSSLAHNQKSDPNFVDPATNDFHVYFPSAVIDNGINVGLSYIGAAPDINIVEGNVRVRGNVIYVSAAADSLTGIGTVELPFSSIGQALKLAKDSSTIYVGKGTYGYSYIDAPRPNFIKLIATDGADSTMIDGSKTTAKDFGFALRTGRAWTIDGFKFINVGKNTYKNQNYTCGVYVDHRVSGVGDSAEVTEIKNCVFDNPNYRAIWVQKFTTVKIHHNLFIGGGNAMVTFGTPEVYNNTFVNVTATGADGTGTVIMQSGDGGSYGTATVKNNIFYKAPIGISNSGECYTYSSNNLYYQVEAPMVDVTADNGGNVMADPKFVDAAKGDYRLYTNSPAIAAGIDVGLGETNPNIGAYAGTGVIGVNDDDMMPLVYALNQNYPNPFNPATVISYSVPKEVNVELKVYDVLGREVLTLVNEIQKPGKYQVKFNASSLSSGVYLYRISAGNFVSVKKMMLIK